MDLGNTVIFYRCFITYKILTLTESCRDIALYGELSTVSNMHIGGSETDTALKLIPGRILPVLPCDLEFFMFPIMKTFVTDISASTGRNDFIFDM